MEKLNPNWLSEGTIDFEYKKYILLAYLQHVNKNFNESRLYPFLNDLIFHYKNLIAIKEKKEFVSNQFPKKLTKLDLENFKLQYERMLEDDKYLEDIQNLIDYAIPQFKNHLSEGKELYEFVENKLEITPVGIVPLNTEFGYILVKEDKAPTTNVFEYEITIFENMEENFRGIKTKFITAFEKNISTTFENMKLQLIKNNTFMPNPATFLVMSKLSFPLNETLLPVAKRSFVRYIASLQ